MKGEEVHSPLLASAKWSTVHHKRRSFRCCALSTTLTSIFAALFFAFLVCFKIVRDNPRKTVWTASSFNSTLGFGKIYAVSLPNFHMRRDEMNLVAMTNDLDLTYMDAVDGRTVAKSQLPYQVMWLTDGEKGCWRSHLNVWKQMLDDGVETALIVEDDFDVDIRIREQLLTLRPKLIDLQLKSGTNATSIDPSRPLPGDWEILWLGACFEQEIDFKIDDPKMNFLHYEDDTVIDRDLMHVRYEEFLDHYRGNATAKGMDPEQWPDSKRYRILQQSQSPYCTTGYALSRRGAARLYYSLTRDIKHAVDVEMGWMSRKYKAYTVVPELISPWKVYNGHNSVLRPLDQDGISEFTDGKNAFDPSIGSSRNIVPEYSAHQLLAKYLTPTRREA